MSKRKKYLSRREQIAALNRIEGQVGGVSKMIDRGECCVDVITQLHAVVGAILSVEDKILDRHLGICIIEAFKEKHSMKKQEKIDEILILLNQRRGRL